MTINIRFNLSALLPPSFASITSVLLFRETLFFKYSSKLTVPEFLMSVSRDLNKGMKLEQAAYKNLDSKGYTRGLLM